MYEKELENRRQRRKLRIRIQKNLINSEIIQGPSNKPNKKNAKQP